jgi:hypothetical protein
MIRHPYDTILFSKVVWISKGKLHCPLHQTESRLTFPELLVLRNYSLKDLLNNCVIMCDVFRYMYTSDLLCKPSASSCLLMTPLNIITLGRNWPAPLQHAITLTFSVLVPITIEYFRNFFLLLHSLYVTYVYATPHHVENVPDLSEKLFSNTSFSRVWKKSCSSVLVHSLIFS